jgi:Fe-S oxidoreductase
LCSEAHLAVSAEETARFWAVRKAAVPILYKLKGEKKILALIEDAVVPTDRLVEYFAGIHAILEQSGVRFVLYGHIAKGLLHTRPLLNLKDPADIARLRPMADAVFALVHGLGGVVSGEHGDGRLRSTYIRRQYPELFDLFRQVKAILDPDNRMNPEIKTSSTPDQMTRHLRYGAGYATHAIGASELVWPEGWETEIERCHGCTKCTTVTTATRMCPIYKFTRREAAAPKAKANILRALISGEVDDAQLFETAFQAVIDQCVGCGSCRRECPSEVDIPKLALEARARYVRRFGSGLHSRLVTNVETLGRVGGRVPGFLKSMADMAPMRRIGQVLTGVSASRPLAVPMGPSLFARLPQRSGQGHVSVLFFTGCYAGYLRPAIGSALVDALTGLGFSVHIPAQHCCGLPLATKGMVRQARAKIRANLERWYQLARRVDHIAVTCSSCGLALAHEWRDLLDTPQVSAVAGKLVHVSRLIADRLDDGGLTSWPVRLAYHQPCHLKVQPDPASSATLMGRLPGVAVEVLASHCCGMAGTWGLAARNDALSRTIGSHLMDLVEAVRADAAVTDCPTCEMQMAHLGRLKVLHPVEVVARVMRQGKDKKLPENRAFC